MPLGGLDRRRHRGEEPIAPALVVEVDPPEPELASRRARLHLSAAGCRKHLGTEADAEHGTAEHRPHSREPRHRGVVAGAHRPAEHHQTSVVKAFGELVTGIGATDVDRDSRRRQPPPEHLGPGVPLVLDHEHPFAQGHAQENHRSGASGMPGFT